MEFDKNAELALVEEAKFNKSYNDQHSLILLFYKIFDVSQFRLKAILAKNNLYIKCVYKGHEHTKPKKQYIAGSFHNNVIEYAKPKKWKVIKNDS